MSDVDSEEGDAGEGAAKETPELIDLIDSSVELRHFVDAHGKGQRVSSHVGSDELCFTKPSVDLDPFQSEHEGYMGNWGNTVDRWYHRAAVVLWPRSRTFAIRAKTSAPWAIGEIAKVLARKNIAEARTMADQIAPFWSSIVRSEDAARIVGRVLQVSRELDDRALAGSLLRPFRVEHLTPKTALALVAVVDHYGLPWFEKACAAFITSAESDDGYDRIAPDQRLAWLRGLPSFVVAVCAAGGGETELARLLLARQWGWMLGQYRGVAHFRPSQVLRELARLDAATLGVLAGSITAGATPLHSEILTFLTSGTCPPRALVQLLKTAQQAYDGRELGRLGLSVVHDHAAKAIEQELRARVRSADDWSIRPPAGCSCALCKELARFLEGRADTRLEWPLATEKRAHVHRRIDDAELPVTHTTLRSGRPYTLVLTKTRALFEREAKERAAQQESLSWLTRTGRLFAPSARSRAAKEPLTRRAAARTPRQ